MFDAIGDPRARCFHESTPTTIGAKRNALCRAAQGEIMVQFDNDDDYAPHVVDRMPVFVQVVSGRGHRSKYLHGRSAHVCKFTEASKTKCYV